MIFGRSLKNLAFFKTISKTRRVKEFYPVEKVTTLGGTLAEQNLLTKAKLVVS